MHCSILLASALAAGTLASHHLANAHLQQRALRTRVLTQTEFTTVTIIVTVTAADFSATLGPLPGSISATATISVEPLPSSSSQPPIQSSISSLLNPSDTGAPIGGSLTPSATISSSIVNVPSSVVSSPSSAVSSASSAVLPPSSAISSVVLTSSSAPAASPTSGVVGPSHITGPAQASLTPDNVQDYRNAILFHHNLARANHGASELTWDTSCEANAKLAAQTCNFAHFVPDGAGQGQNLFTNSGNVFNVTAGITESWYKSEFPAMAGHYGEASLDDTTFHMVGHLTQVLWKATTSVGCFSLDCGANMKVNGASSNLNKYTVCNYSPQGNIGTLYAQNVGSPLSNTNLGSWTD